MGDDSFQTYLAVYSAVEAAFRYNDRLAACQYRGGCVTASTRAACAVASMMLSATTSTAARRRGAVQFTRGCVGSRQCKSTPRLAAYRRSSASPSTIARWQYEEVVCRRLDYAIEIAHGSFND